MNLELLVEAKRRWSVSRLTAQLLFRFQPHGMFHGKSECCYKQPGKRGAEECSFLGVHLSVTGWLGFGLKYAFYSPNRIITNSFIPMQLQPARRSA